MKWWVTIGLTLAAVVAQTTLLDKVILFGVKPDLLLLLAVIYGLLYGTARGAAVGFLGGFLQDLLTGRLLGMHALSKAVAGGLAGLAEREIFKENLAMPFLLTMVGTVLSELIVYSILYAVGRHAPFVLAWKRVIVPEAIYNAVIAPFLYRLLYRYAPAWYAEAEALSRSRTPLRR
ncbi:MAG: rod shape-determining protein MreD [Firmicutes bacterium]|nr:rod shape-determining protein MreD [Bacillota bacterium]